MPTGGGVFQELSLCPNLTAVENTLIRHPEIAGWGWRKRARGLTRQDLVRMMGHLENRPHRSPAIAAAQRAEAVVTLKGTAETGGAAAIGLEVGRGEIVGFAGLDGHGQQAMLRRIFAASRKRDTDLSVAGTIAFAGGDRQTEGIFPLWSVADNMALRSLGGVSRRGIIDLGRETALAADWVGKIDIRSDGRDARITTLSGGNQQKVLFARALASEASIVLLDDPMRGVDVGTKNEVYGLIRREAAGGRSFVWYSTETEELQHCDRV